MFAIYFLCYNGFRVMVGLYISFFDCLLFMNNKFRDLVVFYLEVK